MIAMPVAGLLLILIPFFHKADWILRRSEIKINRIGIDLRMDNRTLVILMGFLLLLSSGYVLFQRDQAAYQNALREAKEAEGIAKEAEKRFNSISDKLMDLTEKISDLAVNLDFQGIDDLLREKSDFFFKVKLTATYYPKDRPEIKLTDEDLRAGKEGFRLSTEERGMFLTARSVRRNDRLAVDGSYDGRKWRGELTFPKSTIRLTKIER